MTIFESQIDLTPAQRHVEQERQFIKQAFFGKVTTVKARFNAFWRHPTLTPQEIADAWGVKCKELFDSHAREVQAILATDPTALQPEDYTPPLPFTYEMENGEPTGRIIIGG